MAHDFADKLKEGHAYETEIDARLARWFRARPVPQGMEWHGVDRVLPSSSGIEYTAEYKADSRAAETENVFIEIQSSDRSCRNGWALTSWAQLLFYYLPQTKCLYAVDMTTLKRELPGWRKRFSDAAAPNKGYCTTGLLVPLVEFEKIAVKWKK